MAFDNGKEIVRQVKRPWPGKSHIGVTIGGERKSVEIRHVSRETANLPLKAKRILDDTGHVGLSASAWSKRDERRARRKARMRLRKLRGWR